MDRTTRFLEQEKTIYETFRQQAEIAREAGLRADPALEQRVGGIGVVVRHPSLAKQLTRITRQLAQDITCFAYRATHVHSTLCAYSEPGFVFDPDAHTTILAELANETASVLATLSDTQRKESKVTYGKPLHNRTTVVVPGIPTRAYVDLLLAINDVCQTVLDVRPSWGSHITAARFLCDHTPSEAASFFEFMRKHAKPLGNVQLTTINVCTFCVEDDRFTLSVAHEFNI